MEAKEELITIVIPVYNLEKYVQNCIDSVLSQTYKNLEILLIDDGSTDNTLTICREYAKTDNRIRIICREHEGLSSIRNYGSKEAKGEFIAHIDGDDILEPTYIEYLYRLMVQYDADISMCNYIPVLEGKAITKEKAANSKDKIKVMTKEQALETLFYQKYFTTATWAKLFKKKLFLNVAFPDGKLAEDMGSTYKLIHYSEKVVYGAQIQYYYLQRAGSIIHALSFQKGKDYVELSADMVKFIEEKYPHLINAACSRCFSSNIQVLSTIAFSEIYNTAHKEIIDNIKKYRKNVLFNPKARLVNRGCAFVSYFGIWALKLGLMVLK